jgi:type IV secretory pathway VirB2 component (pilin)
MAWPAGRAFFPHLIAGPVHDGLVVVFAVAAALAAIAGLASLLRGGRYVHAEEQAAGSATAGERGRDEEAGLRGGR